MDKIEEYVKWLPSKSAKKYYRIYLKKYFEYLKTDPYKYFDSNKDYTNDIREFSVFIQDKYAPGSQQTILNVLKNFFLDNDIQIKPRIWKQIRQRNHLEGDLTIIEEKIPDNSELKQILQHGTVKEQALFLTNATSGERIDETLSLTFDNIQDRHITIQYHDTKKKYKRHTFITLEAREKIDAWLKIRIEYTKRKFMKSEYVRKQYEEQGYKVKIEKIKDSHGKIKERIWHIFKDGKELDFDDFIDIIAKKDNRVFPFGYATASRMWIRMLEAAGHPFNEKDDNPQLKYPYYKYHIHTLRKFMKTQMMSTQINKNHLDAIVGHKNRNRMDRVYAKFRPEVLQESYEEYCDCLAVFSDMSLIDSKYKPKFKEHERQIEIFTEQLKTKDVELQNLKQRLEEMEKKFGNFTLGLIVEELNKLKKGK